jgi:hypothetical protein
MAGERAGITGQRLLMSRPSCDESPIPKPTSNTWNFRLWFFVFRWRSAKAAMMFWPAIRDGIVLPYPRTKGILRARANILTLHRHRTPGNIA